MDVLVPGMGGILERLESPNIRIGLVPVMHQSCKLDLTRWHLALYVAGGKEMLRFGEGECKD